MLKKRIVIFRARNSDNRPEYINCMMPAPQWLRGVVEFWFKKINCTFQDYIMQFPGHSMTKMIFRDRPIEEPIHI